VSKNDDLHCASTTKVELKSHGKEEESLEASLKNRHRGCGRDMLGQTDPSMGSGSGEGSIDGDNDSNQAEHDTL